LADANKQLWLRSVASLPIRVNSKICSTRLIGRKAIKDLAEHDLRAVLRAMVMRGVNRAAVVMRNNVTQMCAWAEKAPAVQQLAAHGAAREMLEAQLAQAQSDIAAHRRANESARQHFAAEIEKLRTESQLAEERYRAAEKRALLEVDRERSTAARLQKELDAARAEAAKALEQYRLETQALQQQLGNMRHQAGMLEGQLEAAKANAERSMRALQDAQGKFTEAAIRLASLESERDALRIHAEDAEKEVRGLKERAKKDRRVRKPKSESS
jgi:chromosome segregation ATPase